MKSIIAYALHIVIIYLLVFKVIFHRSSSFESLSNCQSLKYDTNLTSHWQSDTRDTYWIVFEIFSNLNDDDETFWIWYWQLWQFFCFLILSRYESLICPPRIFEIQNIRVNSFRKSHYEWNFVFQDKYRLRCESVMSIDWRFNMFEIVKLIT